MAAPYFNKIECFCFTEQTLKAGQTVDMPVVFYVDPRIKDDPDTKNIDEITLTYTFYPVESPKRPARARPKIRGKRSTWPQPRTTTTISSTRIPGR